MLDVSIIVPVYKVEKFLSRCLDSLLNQTIQSYEIICINDCSPDRCGDILQKYALKYPNIINVITNEQNLGLGLSRNKGIEASRGEYLMFVDSDDYVEPDYVESYLREMRDNPVDIIIGGYIREVGTKRRVHLLSKTVWSMVTYAIACAKMFRKDFLISNSLRFIDIKSGEDIYFSLSAFYHGASFRVIDYAGYYYVFNNASITGAMNYKKNYEDIMIELFSSFFKNHDLSKLSQKNIQIIEYAYIANMVNALVVFDHGCGIRRMKEKRDRVLKDLNYRFPNYRNNPYLGILKPKGQTLKIRLGVGIVHYLARLKLDGLFFYAISLVK